MSPWDRCITRSPTNLFPAGYNNGYQIVQTPDYVDDHVGDDPRGADHPARRTAARRRGASASGLATPEAAGKARRLVVDTTNFRGSGWIATHAGAGRLRGVPHTKALHIVERLTRVDASTMIYEATIEDPGIYRTAMDVLDAVRQERRLSDLRVRLPRGKRGDRPDAARCPHAGTRGGPPVP